MTQFLQLSEAVKPYYQQAHRKYHTWAHIEEMIAALRKYFPDRKSANLEAAILFHDIIYIPGSGHNEAMSAELIIPVWNETFGTTAVRFNDGLFAPIKDLVDHTTIGSYMTRTEQDYQSQGEPSLYDRVIIQDLDLIALSYPWAEFLDKQDLLVEEFSCLGSKIEIKQKQAKFLNQLLVNSDFKIFKSKEMRHLNPVALSNITSYVNLVFSG